MTKGYASIAGEIKPIDEACVPALDRGFLFGDNVFEVIVAFYGKFLNFQRHIARLRQSAEQLAIDLPWSDQELEFELTNLVSLLDEPKAYVRFVVSRGTGLGLKVTDQLQPNKFAFAFPAHQEPAQSYSEGLALKLDHLPYTERKPMAKTGNYLRSILALKKAHEEHFQDVLWANSERELTEATTANIFLLGRDGDLVEVATPPANSGILLGITRMTLCELLNHAKIPVTERIIGVDEIPRFDEAFICSTVRGLVPVSRIGSHRLHTLRRNSVFQHIHRLHSAWVQMNIGFKVDWNTGERLGEPQE